MPPPPKRVLREIATGISANKNTIIIDAALHPDYQTHPEAENLPSEDNPEDPEIRVQPGGSPDRETDRPSANGD